MPQRNTANTMKIIIPCKDKSFSTNKEDILQNLKDISPEQVVSIGREMKVAREIRENEIDKVVHSKYGNDVSKFKDKVGKEKTKNMNGFHFEDYKVTENGERVGIVLLYDYSRDYENAFSDLEYGTKIFIKVGNFETSKELIYRDAYDADKDDWSKAYTQIRRLEIQGDTLKIWLAKKR